MPIYVYTCWIQGDFQITPLYGVFLTELLATEVAEAGVTHTVLRIPVPLGVKQENYHLH